MQAVRQDFAPADYAEICKVLEDNPAYPFSGLGNTFPKDPTAIPNSTYRRLRPLKLADELNLQISRLNHHSKNIGAALNSLATINEHFSERRFDACVSMIEEHKRTHGHSIVLLKKDLLVALERHNLAGLSKRYKEITAGYENTAWAVLAHYIYDLMDPTYDPTRATRTWLHIGDSRIADTRSGYHSWYARVLQDDILGISPDSSTLSSALLSYAGLSLLDLTLFIWSKHHTHPTNSQLRNSLDHLNEHITDILVKKFSKFPIAVSHAYCNHDQSFPDVEIYRTSFFFTEIASVSQWRSSISSLVFSERPHETSYRNENYAPRLNSAAEDVRLNPDTFDYTITSLRDWETSLLSENLPPEDQDFLSAVIIAESARRMIGAPPQNTNSVINLLASANDVQRYISVTKLKELIETPLASASPLLTFIFWELIYRRTRSPDNELERRLSFMHIFKESGDIIAVLESIAIISPSAAMLLARTCTRTFLERLFMMMTSVKDVLEARLLVCDWLIQREDTLSDNLEEEREAVSRELSNLEARSDLDSTRVHVDEESLREWFESTHRANVSRYKQTALAEGPSATFGSLLAFFSMKEKSGEDEDDFTADTQIGSEFLLVSIVDAALTSFISDRTFGLDAYLSRRIRHGTLSGHVMTPVTRALGRIMEHIDLHERAHNTTSLLGVKRLADEWRRFLVLELDHTRKSIIQIRSEKHPAGLIQAQWRTANNIQHLDAMIARVKSRVIDSKGSYDIFPDIYAFCWDCLEADLAQLRLFMIREFSPKAIRKLGELFEELSTDERKFTFPLLHELRQILEARVQDVCGWFIRPVFRRDRYNLKMLISTTLSIVKELDYSYAFSEEVIVSDEISLNRGSFDVFGDMLFVLLGNAARHGKRDGRIRVSGVLLQIPDEVVELEITSEVTNIEEYHSAIKRIEDALEQDPVAIYKAAVEEGFSGLMKLAGLMRRVRSSNSSLSLIADDEKLEITFSLRLPTEITVTRMRG